MIFGAESVGCTSLDAISTCQRGIQPRGHWGEVRQQKKERKGGISVLLAISSKGFPNKAIERWTRLQADRKHVRFIAVT